MKRPLILSTPSGTRHPNARFRDPELAEIRKELAQGKPGSAIAKERGCAPSTIRRIERHESYREG